MGIVNPAQLGAQDIRATVDVTLELVLVRPDTSVILTTPDIPGRLFGYYDPAFDTVRLYVIDRSGFRILSL